MVNEDNGAHSALVGHGSHDNRHSSSWSNRASVLDKSKVAVSVGLVFLV